ncbi:hypothetical protein ACS0TY_015827 [Phlomoides rotata]
MLGQELAEKAHTRTGAKLKSPKIQYYIITIIWPKRLFALPHRRRALSLSSPSSAKRIQAALLLSLES